MSAEATGWVYRHSPMRGAAFTVHLALADSANDQNGYELWMRVRTIAEKARLSEGAARRAIADLIDAGLLEVIDDGRSREDAESSTRPRRFIFVMPGGARDVFTPPRRVRGSANQTRAHGAGARAEDAGTRAHGAGDLQPKENPSENPSPPPTPSAQLSLVSMPQPPAARDEPLTLVGFDAFWRAYPLKAGKGAARKAWQRAIRRAAAADIIAGAQRYAADPNRPEEFTKYPEGWLNADRWDDDPLPPRSGRDRGMARSMDAGRAVIAAFGADTPISEVAAARRAPGLRPPSQAERLTAAIEARSTPAAGQQ